MAQFPTSSTSRPVDPVVQGLVYALANEQDNFIADKALPDIDTDAQQSGTIMGYGIEAFFGNIDANYRRGAGASWHESHGPKAGSATFRCQEYGDSVPMDLMALSRTQFPHDLKAAHIFQIMQNLKIAREVRVASIFSTTGNWTNSATPGTKWDADGGDPIGSIETAIETVAAYGLRPNTMILGRQARRTLQKASAILEFLPTTGDRNIMPSGMLRGKLADLFEIKPERILYGNAVRNSVSIGQTVAMGDIWGDFVWVGYLNNAGVPFGGGVQVQPTAAARFTEKGWDIAEWDDENRNSIKARLCHSEDEVVVQAQLGYTINDVTT